jgi:MoaA/NifB/PqqE/SkfB family radical SAM enzyme
VRAARYLAALAYNHAGAVPRPSWCTYLVCYRCNARCGMCDSWRLKPGSEMSPTEVATVFGKIGPLDVVRVSGGEPFLREDLLAVADEIVRASDPLVLHVTTNGSFPARVEHFATRVRARRLQVMVSLDGEPEEHDRNRGAEVTFDRALDTIARLRSLGVAVSVNHTVISRRSLDDAQALKDRMAGLGVDVHVVLAYADSAMYGIKLRGKKATALLASRYPLHPNLEGADVIGFVDRELAALDGIHDLPTRVAKRYYLRGLRQRLTATAEVARGPRCVALRSHIRLLPDGGVPVCQFNTERVGNLLTHSFAEVWHGADAATSRAWVDACAGCWAECEVLPSAIYTGDLLRALG